MNMAFQYLPKLKKNAYKLNNSQNKICLDFKAYFIK